MERGNLKKKIEVQYVHPGDKEGGVFLKNQSHAI